MSSNTSLSMSTHASPTQWILHLGLGSFHRAHQAVYLNQLHQLGDTSWALAGGHIRPDMPDTIAALQAQGGAYTLETVSPQGAHAYERITAIKEVIDYTPDLAGLVAKAAQAHTKIISFTVTEAGYYLDANDTLDFGFQDLAHDLQAVQAGHAGHTIYGALCTLLRARMAAQAGPLTLLNCDNLRHNGARARTGLLQFITRVGDESLLAWVQANTTCPNGMVDRITPRPTPAVAQRVKAATGVVDAASLMGERFIQWVIEDNFIAGRPALERVGVEMTNDVAPFEEAKIRLLNATHSCIAWAGTLLGMTYIHEGSLHAPTRQLAYDYVTQDTIPVLTPSPLDLPTYRDVVLERFCNEAIADTNQRVAMDGFSKIPGFIAPTIRQRLARGESIAAVAMLPALFLAYLQRWHVGGIAYEYQDQAMDPAAAHNICDAVDPVKAFAANAILWADLAGQPALEDALRAAHQRVLAFVAQHAPRAVAA
jgi:D-arabinitol 4-dehydrogenase